MDDDDQGRPAGDAPELADEVPHERPGRGPAVDDVAFARLRAADPAGADPPDLTAVLASVRSATGVPVAVAAGPEVTMPVDELSARRARRTPRWLQVAAVVAGIAVVGGGSYALGDARTGAPALSAPAAAPAMNVGGGRGGGDSAAAPQAATNGVGAAGSDARIAGWGVGRTVFEATGLPTAKGSAAAYGFDAAGTYAQATAERAAAALGVSGTAQQQYGSWTVGPNDGTAPTVSVSSDGLTSLSYNDPTRDPWTCLKSGVVPIQPPTAQAGTEGSGGAAGPVAIAPSPEPCRTTTGPAPTASAAVGQARDVMTALGVDPAGFEIEPSADPGVPVTSVSAYQVVDGQRSGVSWTFTVGPSGIQSLNGSLAPTVALGSYDVVSPTEAVARLTDPRFGPSYGGVVPLAADARAAGAGVATSQPAPGPSDEPTVPATPRAGSPLAWPVQRVTIVSARLGLALTTLPDGASVLAPTYELADAAGATWTVLAVADPDLDFAG